MATLCLLLFVFGGSGCGYVILFMVLFDWQAVASYKIGGSTWWSLMESKNVILVYFAMFWLMISMIVLYTSFYVWFGCKCHVLIQEKQTLCSIMVIRLLVFVALNVFDDFCYISSILLWSIVQGYTIDQPYGQRCVLRFVFFFWIISSQQIARLSIGFFSKIWNLLSKNVWSFAMLCWWVCVL